MSITHLTTATYEDVVGKGRVLVDFWAGWCTPCKMVAPVIEELAAEYDGRVTVAKVDVDSEGDIAIKNNIQSIPTVILYNNGVEVRRFIGVQQKAVYKAELDG